MDDTFVDEGGFFKDFDDFMKYEFEYISFLQKNFDISYPLMKDDFSDLIDMIHFKQE